MGRADFDFVARLIVTLSLWRATTESRHLRLFIWRDLIDMSEADRIRKELLEAGVVLEDSAAGTTWRRA